jgi:hypothetical protein
MLVEPKETRTGRNEMVHLLVRLRREGEERNLLEYLHKGGQFSPFHIDDLFSLS